jgi:hypothetical protein
VLMTDSTWVICCCWISDAEDDVGYPTIGMQEVQASSRDEAVSALKANLNGRLIDIISMTEWKDV